MNLIDKYLGESDFYKSAIKKQLGRNPDTPENRKKAEDELYTTMYNQIMKKHKFYKKAIKRQIGRNPDTAKNRYIAAKELADILEKK